MSDSLQILLFYKYVALPDPAATAAAQRELCSRLGLTGRIILAGEGINGTLGGRTESVVQYREAMRSDRYFSDIEFKISESTSPPFPKLSIKVRPELVSLHASPDVPVDALGTTHLSPEQWQRMIDSDPEAVLVDVRNSYESEVGRFKNAVRAPIDNFRELPAAMPSLAHLKHRKVMLYCTGGIRCEKAAGLFLREGFERVYQLHGGIVSYIEKFPHGAWEGSCFVFDQRMLLDGESRKPVGVCAHSGVATTHFTNCLHDPCHKLFLVDEAALRSEPNFALCPECLARGLTPETAEFNRKRPVIPGQTRNARRRRQRKIRRLQRLKGENIAA
jgi:UPF0176 protein